MNQMNLNLIAAKTLTDVGVDTLFGVMGDAVMYLIEHYVNDCDGRYIKAFHESGAVQMAISYSQLTDKIGVAACTCGPGFVNTIGALMEARKSNTPVVLITAGSPSIIKEHFQEMNHGAVTLACEIGYVEPVNPDRVQDAVIESIEKAMRERRPVVLNLLPYDLMQNTTAQYRDVPSGIQSQRATVTTHSAVEGCVEAIANAKRPLILVGYGAIKNHALSEINQLADRLEAPIVTTLRAKDSFVGHKWHLGIMGTLGRPETLDIINKSDCIIALGASCNSFTTVRGSLVNDKTLIMIGSEDQLMYRFTKPRNIVNGDIPSALTEIMQWLDEAELQPSAFALEHDVIAALELATQPRLDDLKRVSGDALTLDYACAKLNKAMTEKIVVTDVGRFVRSAWSNLHSSKPEYFIAPSNFAAIGMGMGMAIGAAVAVPDVPVLALVGDGGFMLGGINELFSIRTMGLDIVTVIINDGTYGAEYVKFEKNGLDPNIANIETPPFAEVASAMGFKTMTVTDKQQLDEALELIKLRDKKTPLLIEVKLPATSIRHDD
ncbi:thiamine pyrophosphate-binding protein [Alcaligenaceae bacterium]|nr:thiamine pyrophosphate-binding protein [Alcaligenaceae bacterium]